VAVEERDKGFARLREPFPAEHVGLLPRVTKKDGKEARCQECGRWLKPHIHLSYVGHAAVTDRLLEVDPEWNWQPKAGWDETGEPKFVRDRNGSPVRLWIDLTVLGITRSGVGTVEPNAFDAEKQLIGDALRNAAMRFGVALDLWIKGHEEEEPAASQEPPDPEQWFLESGWKGGSEEHDAVKEDVKATLRSLPDDRPEEKSYRQQALDEWSRRGLKFPLTYGQMESWAKFLVPLGRKAKKDSGAGDAGGETESEPAPEQPTLDENPAVGPDAPLVKRG